MLGVLFSLSLFLVSGGGEFLEEAALEAILAEDENQREADLPVDSILGTDMRRVHVSVRLNEDRVPILVVVGAKQANTRFFSVNSTPLADILRLHPREGARLQKFVFPNGRVRWQGWYPPLAANEPESTSKTSHGSGQDALQHCLDFCMARHQAYLQSGKKRKASVLE